MANAAPDRGAELRDTVYSLIVAPDYVAAVRDIAVWRRRWRKIANWAEGLAYALVGVTSILAFAAGYFEYKGLSFASGICAIVSTALLGYSKYANHESSERTVVLDRLLAGLGLGPVPDLVADLAPSAVTLAPSPVLTPSPTPAPQQAAVAPVVAVPAAAAAVPGPASGSPPGVETRAAVGAGGLTRGALA